MFYEKLVRKHLRSANWAGLALKGLAAAAVLYLVSWGCRRLGVLPALLAGVVAYLFSLVLSGGLDQKDAALLKGLLPAGKQRG